MDPSVANSEAANISDLPLVLPAPASSNPKKRGRQKVEIKMVTDESRRQVTFSKRRMGLFKKASELCELCGVEIGIVTFSRRGKLFTFGSPHEDVVIQKYLSGSEASGSSSAEAGNRSNYDTMLSMAKQQYMESVSRLEEEKKMKGVVERKKEVVGCTSDAGDQGGVTEECWWDQEIERMSLEELEKYAEAINALRENVGKRAEELGNHQFSYLQ